jgi:AcrR family transcriptional regulator
MKYTRKQDWLETGLQILGQDGVKGLTIQKLTGELDVTKGSFYHHFDNVQAYRKQLISFWADQYLTTAGNPAEEAGSKLALLDLIMAEAFSPMTEPEIAIRIWAQQDELVRDLVEKVDRSRHAFVLQVFQEVAQDEEQARLMADMLFTISIGSLTALPRLPAERVQELYSEFKRLYGLGDRAGRSSG